jgi:hypothetical protein
MATYPQRRHRQARANGPSAPDVRIRQPDCLGSSNRPKWARHLLPAVVALLLAAATAAFREFNLRSLSTRRSVQRPAAISGQSADATCSQSSGNRSHGTRATASASIRRTQLGPQRKGKYDAQHED